MQEDKKCKIGYVLTRFPTLSETFIINEILELENQGLNLHLFSLRESQDKIFHKSVLNLKAGLTYVPSLIPGFRLRNIKNLLLANVRVFRQIPKRYSNSFLFHISHRVEENTLNEFLQAGYLVDELKQQKISHIHAHFAKKPTAVAEIINSLSGITYSFSAHAQDIYLSHPKILDRWMQKAEFVLTCTKYNQEYLRDISMSKTPIYLSYHGLDLNRFKPISIARKEKNEILSILSVGRFCEKKGFPVLIEACELLQQKNLKFRCIIVGYGNLKPVIERLIRNLKLENIVTIIGQLSQDELIALYRKADVFVLPCQIATNGDRDGIPNVLLEAMAMGVPVISTRISGIPELIMHQKNGLLAGPKNPKSLAEQIEYISKDEHLKQELVRAGYETVRKHFSVEKNVTKIKKLFEKLVC